MKVHIAPSGWEKDIILKTIYKSGADKIYLITSKIKNNELEKIDVKTNRIAKEVKEELSKFAKVNIIKASYINYFEAFQDICNLIKKELKKGNKISVNIAGGNKLIAAVLFTAASMYNLKVFYTIPLEYNEELLKPEIPLRTGVHKIIEIPTPPLNIKLTKREKELLKLINDKQIITVKNYIEKFKCANENRSRAGFSYYINKFQKLGLIKVKNFNGRRKVCLTKSGKLLSNIVN